jgi:hypothetical protein
LLYKTDSAHLHRRRRPDDDTARDAIDDDDVHCRFCNATETLETHHVVPKKFGGQNTAENTITVCTGCHKVIERVWDRRFYQQIGVRADMTPNQLFDRLKDLQWTLRQVHGAVTGGYQWYETRVEYADSEQEAVVFRAKRDALLDLLEGEIHPPHYALEQLKSDVDDTQRLIDYLDFEEGR